MRSFPYSAFLSYSSRYRDWVETLHANLEATLDLHGESRPIFLDRIDVAAGSSWVTQLAAGVDQAAKLVLVVTPEAMASPRVADEWQALVDSRRHWSRGRLVPAMLVWAPLPLFLGPIQYVDFRGHDDAVYAEKLRQLAGALLELPPAGAGHSAFRWTSPCRERPSRPSRKHACASSSTASRRRSPTMDAAAPSPRPSATTSARRETMEAWTRPRRRWSSKWGMRSSSKYLTALHHSVLARKSVPCPKSGDLRGGKGQPESRS